MAALDSKTILMGSCSSGSDALLDANTGARSAITSPLSSSSFYFTEGLYVEVDDGVVFLSQACPFGGNMSDQYPSGSFYRICHISPAGVVQGLCDSSFAISQPSYSVKRPTNLFVSKQYVVVMEVQSIRYVKLGDPTQRVAYTDKVELTDGKLYLGMYNLPTAKQILFSPVDTRWDYMIPLSFPLNVLLPLKKLQLRF